MAINENDLICKFCGEKGQLFEEDYGCWRVKATDADGELCCLSISCDTPEKAVDAFVRMTANIGNEDYEEESHDTD